MSTTINITETAVNVVVTEATINIEASGGQGPVGVGVPAGGTAGQILAKINSTNYNTQWINNTDLVGLTSVGVSMPAAFSVANSPLTANGTIAVTGAGNALQYINGLGNLVTFPTLTGFVTSVTGTSPIASSGGTTPAISIAQATTSVSGFLSSTDWNTFNGKQNALTNPVTGTGTTNTLPKFTGASAIGNSNITDTGTAIALNSDTAIGTTTLAAATKLTLGGSETAVSAIARGGLINSTLVASANSDVLVGLDINPTFTNGAFTGVNNIGLRVNGTIAATGVLTLNRNTSSTIIFADASETTIINTSFTARLAFRIGSTDYGRFFPTSGNFTLQNGGTYTDSGFRLDVTGTSRLNGQTTITGSTTAASALARGIIATPTLVAAANGDVLVGLDINTTYTLGAFTSVKTMGLRVDGINIGRGSGNIGTNTAIGASALENNTTGAQNTALGGIALRNTTTGGFNTAIGYNSLTVNSTGSENVAIGRNAGEGNTTSSNNTYIGTNAASFNTTGSSNTFIGHNAGRFITGGSTANTISNNSIFIGQDCRAAADNQSNQIVIGRATTGLGTNTTIIGTTATTITGLYGNIRLVSGMGTAPATSTSTGTTGDIVVTAGFIYVCSATNTWVRTILTTF